MSFILRPETPADYATIAAIHIRAFGRIEESVIVPLLRQRQQYDPELSLVAEQDGRVIGHALFMPYRIRLMNADVNVICLAPIGIDVAFQKQGIGSALIAEGHRIAQHKNYALSFLLGHTDYYPRFGYNMGMFGLSSIQVTASPEADILRPKPVQESYLPALLDLWQREESRVDFAIVPEMSLIDWLSPNPLVQSEVYLKHGAIVGYTRIQTGETPRVLVFLAQNAEAAQSMVATLTKNNQPITLPLHPFSASAAAFGTPKAEAWQAAMACSLMPGVLDEYKAQVESGKRPPGRVIWGTAFELA